MAVGPCAMDHPWPGDLGRRAATESETTKGPADEAAACDMAETRAAARHLGPGVARRAAHHARRAIRARAGCGVGRPSTVYSCNPYRVYALRSGPPVRQAAPACGGPFQHWGPFRRVLIHRGDVIRVDDVEDPAVSGARRVVSRWKVEGDPGATRLVDVHVERKCASHASRSYTYTGAPSSSPHFHLVASGLSCEAVQLISHGSQRASSR